MTDSGNYYDLNLSGQRLKRVYDIVPPRIQRYLQAEIDHVLGHIKSGDIVLDLGCGYGRILPALAQASRIVIGADISMANLRLGQENLRTVSNVRLACMDASQIACGDRTLDLVVCIQNGISAFHVDRHKLLRECIRITRPGGIILFSTYSVKIWDDRLDWFERQAAEGLLGEIDRQKTRDGEIVCKDGFTATTIAPQDFQALVDEFPVIANLVEVDQSCIFCEIMVS